MRQLANSSDRWRTQPVVSDRNPTIGHASETCLEPQDLPPNCTYVTGN